MMRAFVCLLVLFLCLVVAKHPKHHAKRHSSRFHRRLEEAMCGSDEEIAKADKDWADKLLDSKGHPKNYIEFAESLKNDCCASLASPHSSDSVAVKSPECDRVWESVDAEELTSVARSCGITLWGGGFAVAGRVPEIEQGMLSTDFNHFSVLQEHREFEVMNKAPIMQYLNAEPMIDACMCGGSWPRAMRMWCSASRRFVAAFFESDEFLGDCQHHRGLAEEDSEIIPVQVFFGYRSIAEPKALDSIFWNCELPVLIENEKNIPSLEIRLLPRIMYEALGFPEEFGTSMPAHQFKHEFVLAVTNRFRGTSEEVKASRLMRRLSVVVESPRLKGTLLNETKGAVPPGMVRAHLHDDDDTRSFETVRRGRRGSKER